MTTQRRLAGDFRKGLNKLWSFVREVSGDDAYQRYLERHERTHPDVTPLQRKAFFAAEQQRKWDGITRCC